MGGGGATVYRVLRGDRDLNFGSRHCGTDIKYMTMGGHIQSESRKEV